MKLERQVCSRALAERLEKLGVGQNSYFVWWYTEAMAADVKYFPEVDWDKREWSIKPRTKSMEGSGRDVAAFTTAELGELIGSQARSYRTDNLEQAAWQCGGTWIKYVGKSPTYPSHSENAETEADARAKMLVYLIEKKLLKPQT